MHQGRKKVSKYSDKEKRDAVDYYLSHDCNVMKTVKDLGYPSRPLLVQWIKELHPEKEKGISLDKLTNREKVFLIDALRNKYKLNELLSVLNLSKSSYCYQVQCIKREGIIVSEKVVRRIMNDEQLIVKNGLGLYVVKCLAEKMNMKVVAKLDGQRFCVSITSAYS